MRVPGIVLWCCLIPGVALGQGGPETSTPEGPSAGSAAILNACWTPAELAGRPEELATQHRLKRDPKPPPAWALEAADRALPGLAPDLLGSVRRVEPQRPGERLIALTFDLCELDGERAGYDGALVDALRRLGVQASFFASGHWLRTHAERAMQLMADPSFEIGNHAWTHANLRQGGLDLTHQQVQWTQAEYAALRQQLAERPCAQAQGPAELARVPPWPRAFRFPYGVCSAESLAAVNDLGLVAVQWSLVTGDPDPQRSAQAIARSVLDGVRRGQGHIVVAHANGHGRHTAEALPLFVPQLQAQGYRFVTVSALLAAGQPKAVEACYEQIPGDNLRYDRLLKPQATGTKAPTPSAAPTPGPASGGPP